MNDLYIHWGSDKFDRNKFTSVKNISYLNKPMGGLWASPVTADYGWSSWNNDNEFEQYNDDEYFVFRLTDNAKILNITNNEEVQEVLDKYAREETEIMSIMEKKFVDYEKLVRDYDAVNFVENSDTHWPFYGWDCDTLLVMNADVISPQDKSVL